MGRTYDAGAARTHESEESYRNADATEATRITGTVDIAAVLASAALPGATLFVCALEPGTQGPPLAVRKLEVDRWPISFVLDDADAMIPGRTLSASHRIQLEARISLHGEALPRAGDLVGRLENVDPRTTEPVSISIDQKMS
jgi:hypothetical protein